MIIAITRRSVIEACTNNLIRAGIVNNNQVERDDIEAMLKTMNDHELTQVLLDSHKMAESGHNAPYLVGEISLN